MRATMDEIKETLRTQGYAALRIHKDGFTIRNREEERKMKKANVEVGKVYEAKVSGKVVKVKLTGESRFGGWDALNLTTNKTIRIKSAQRLRSVPTPKVVVEPAAGGDEKKTDKPEAQKEPKAAKAQKVPKEKRMSGLDAAAEVLKEAGEPLDAKTMTERAIARGWKTSGKTPAATVYSAIIREIGTKGSDSRFKKTERGKFTLAN